MELKGHLRWSKKGYLDVMWGACVVLISINIIGLLNGVVLWKFPMKVGSGVVCTKCITSVFDHILDYPKSGWKCVAYWYFGHMPSLKWKVLCAQYSNKKIYMHHNRRLPISFKHRIQILLVTAYVTASAFWNRRCTSRGHTSKHHLLRFWIGKITKRTCI